MTHDLGNRFKSTLPQNEPKLINNRNSDYLFYLLILFLNSFYYTVSQP